MRAVAVINQKGGVGKTTTTVNLGAALALRGHRVLLIDADPQGNATDHLGLGAAGAEREALERSLYDVLIDGASLESVALSTDTENLWIVPADADLAAAEAELAPEIGREFRLRKALRALSPEAYDWVLVDCPPSLGLLSVNAMAAVHEVLIALQTEYFALRGLESLNQVMEMVKEHLNPDLRLLGILPTLVNNVTILSREVIDEIKQHYGNVLLDTRIRQNISLAEAPSQGMHIFQYKPGSPGASDYISLANELLGVREPKPRRSAARVRPAVDAAGRDGAGDDAADRERNDEGAAADPGAPTPARFEAPSVPDRTDAPAAEGPAAEGLASDRTAAADPSPGPDADAVEAGAKATPASETPARAEPDPA